MQSNKHGLFLYPTGSIVTETIMYQDGPRAGESACPLRPMRAPYGTMNSPYYLPRCHARYKSRKLIRCHVINPKHVKYPEYHSIQLQQLYTHHVESTSLPCSTIKYPSGAVVGAAAQCSAISIGAYFARNYNPFQLLSGAATSLSSRATAVVSLLPQMCHATSAMVSEETERSPQLVKSKRAPTRS